MTGQGEKVRAFFQRAAGRYRQSDGAVSQLYFAARLRLALKMAATQPAHRILDVGCGTGLLYHQLCYPVSPPDGTGRFAAPISYLGIDLSSEMLKKSGIPERQRREVSFADFHANTPATQRYDRIFALGFTTYLTENEQLDFHRALAERLSPNGLAVISYTHAGSYDFRFRNTLNRYLGRWLPNDTSLGRDFPILVSDPVKIKTSLPTNLRVLACEWLPPTFPGLNKFPVSWQNWLKENDKERKWSGDFLLLISRNTDGAN